MGNLTAAAHFWAMHSCRFLKVTKAEQQQTKQLCLCNIAFIKNGKILNHSLTKLHLADCVSVTFEKQKKQQKIRYSHAVESKRSHPMPRENMSNDCHANALVRRNKHELTHLSLPSQEEIN
jgi:hypothetical protein